MLDHDRASVRRLAIALGIILAVPLTLLRTATTGTVGGYLAAPTSTPDGYAPTPALAGGATIEDNYFVFLPNITKSYDVHAPDSAFSRYMSAYDSPTLNQLGKERGGCLGTGTLAPKDGFLILDFGQAWNDSGSPTTYGARLFYFSELAATISQLENGIRAFLSGYYNCVATKPNTFLVLALGVNNSDQAGYTNFGHGQAWAEMINRLNDYITTPPSWGDKIRVVGAMDFEPGFGPAANARAWADGYNAAHRHEYYNFGSCDGCPIGSFVANQPIANGWTLDDIWYLNYGVSPAYPLPEIYNTLGADAQKWQTASLYAASCSAPCEPALVGPPRMFFSGVMTQQQACLDNDVNGIPDDDCHPTVRNSPQQGWQQPTHRSAEKRGKCVAHALRPYLVLAVRAYPTDAIKEGDLSCPK